MIGAAGGPQATRARVILARMLSSVGPLVAANALALAEAGLSQREAERTLREVAGRLAATIASHFRGRGEHGAPATLEGIVDIEESVWSPKYGIKGVIDVTAVARFFRGADGVCCHSGNDDGVLGVTSVEFKSGKRYYTHAAQVSISLIFFVLYTD
jgi:hypothetical protein